jgi:hypothetical protein
MKILLLCGGRVGSYSVAEWLSEELNLKFIVEQDYSVDYKIENNIIVKRTIGNNDFEFRDVIYFDKIIILYRENTLKQAESNLYAVLNNNWHHTSKTKQDGYYEIDEDFLIENHDNLWGSKRDLDRQKKEMLNLNFGIKISYEDIFEEEIGQKTIEEYVGFKSKTLINNKLKLRKNNNNLSVRSYEREINKLTLKLEELFFELKEIKINNKVLENKIEILKKNKRSLL